MASPRIPDMFLRALKRKQVAVAGTTSGTAAASSTTPTKDGKRARSVDCEQNAAPAEKKEKSSKSSSHSNNCDKSKPESAASGDDKVDSFAETTAAKIVEEAVAEAAAENRDAPLLSLVRDSEWTEALQGEFQKKYIGEIESFLRKERTQNKKVFPPRSEIFSALQMTPLSAVKVVIIGQDPYHNDGQAHGLSFSVKRGVPPPPSLKNIYKELAVDIPGFKAPAHGYLEGWARQGILMLNAALTVRAHEANSHAKIGWYTLTDRMISIVSKEKEGVVFLLWGGFAHKKAALVDAKKHAIVQTAHPSPLSARFFLGCRCFSKVNEHLVAFGKDPIDWSDL